MDKVRAVQDKNEGELAGEDAFLIGADGGARLRMQGLNHTFGQGGFAGNKLVR